jgi:hypothetical protein
MPESLKDERRPPVRPLGANPGMNLTRTSRFETWEQDLAEFLESAANRPFAWGSHDCCLFVSEAIRIMTGTDIAEIKHWRGNYHDETGAYFTILKGMRTRSFRIAVERLAREFGFPVWNNPALAQRGDVALARDHEGREALGIVDVDGRWVACLGLEGLIRLPVDRILIAWKI